MSFVRRVFIIAFAVWASPLRAAFPGLRYVDDIGSLGTEFDPRTSISLGRTRVVAAGDGNVRLEGRDDSGKTWQALLPTEGGIGFTTLWTADFDRNSRSDIMVAAYFPSNGRCVDEITLSFLLFDDHGRPVPWVIETRMPASARYPYIPGLFTDMHHDGRAELKVTDCAYGNPIRLGEDRRITGIYKAKDAAWNLLRPAAMAPYTDLVRRSYRFQPGADRLVPADPAHWTDQGNRIDPQGPPPVRLVSVLPRSPDCRGVRLPPIVNGRIDATGWKDPCDEIGENRIELSSGTLCFGWPTVVRDRPDGRYITVGEENVRPILQRIVEETEPVVLTGTTNSGRCSPTILWILPSG
jgi:hypothetical protein